MLLKPIYLNNISLSFPHKTCFEDFSAKICQGDFIAIIGNNGTGKSSLLKIIKATSKHNAVNCSYIEQIPPGENISGAQRFHKALSKALASDPDLLILDEPTNHLDTDNKENLIYMLNSLQKTIIIASHDKNILSYANIIWHINGGKITEFRGNYAEYIIHNEQENIRAQAELSRLNKEKGKLHQSLMKEQLRAAKSKETGKKHIDNKKWPTIVSKAKTNRASITTGKKKAKLSSERKLVSSKLSDLYIPKKITPNFVLDAKNSSNKNILSIVNGNIGYEENQLIIKDLNIQMSSIDRLGIIGKNASGKSTILKSIMNDKSIVKSGDWNIPNPEYIGYLDQHYEIINSSSCPYELIKDSNNSWNNVDIRMHLNSYLFRKNEEVYNKIFNLSGGEKARLSLALIGSKPIKLLLLDEITNNIDLETKEYVIEILKKFPGAIIIVSHDTDFLEQIGISYYLEL